MKKLLFLLSMTILSASVYAASVELITSEPEAKLNSISDKVAAESSPIPDLALNEAIKPQSNLWEILDTDKDGLINKTEATLSKSVYEQWDSLDVNKDNKLDTEEFSQYLSQQN